MEVTIGQFAKLVGSTVRTLRYYDKIGLLSPRKLNNSGRKVYTRLELDGFQQIMILKHFDFSLNEIKEQLNNEKLKKRDVLRMQKELIEKRQAELQDMLEVITRMDRLYDIEGASEEEVDEFAFIMLDLLRREKQQIQAYEGYFKDDKRIMNELRILHDPEYKRKADEASWKLLQAIRSAMQNHESKDREKAREMLDEMDHLFPMNRELIKLMEDKDFVAKHIHEFNNYFPEDIADYILKELNTYYNEKS